MNTTDEIMADLPDSCGSRHVRAAIDAMVKERDEALAACRMHQEKEKTTAWATDQLQQRLVEAEKRAEKAEAFIAWREPQVERGAIRDKQMMAECQMWADKVTERNQALFGLSCEFDDLRARYEEAVGLLRRVYAGAFGIACSDSVDGKNWFDDRDDILAKHDEREGGK